MISTTELEYLITRKLDYTINKKYNPHQEKNDETFNRLYTSGIYYISILYNQWGVNKIMLGLKTMAGLTKFIEVNIFSEPEELRLLVTSFSEIKGKMSDVYYNYIFSLDDQGNIIGYKDSSENYWNKEMGIEFYLSKPMGVITEILQTGPLDF